MRLKLFSIVAVLFFTINAIAQAPGCPNINAGPDQNLNCTNPCTNLSATILNTGQTSTYNVSSQPYAPPFPFTGGTSLFVGQDDIFSGVINLPFNFCFYGNTYNQCVIGANGNIVFDPALANASCNWSFTAGIPSGGTTPPYYNSINGAYLDLDPSSGGDINYAVQGTAPCRMLVVNFSNIPQYQCNNLLVSQQIVLYETTNVIEVYIANKATCTSWNSGNAVIGIQDATGANGITPPGRNTGAWTANNEGWRFTPSGPPNWVVNWYENNVNIGNGLNINVCPTASTTYVAEVTYTNCDNTVVLERDSVNVNVNGTPPNADAGNDTTICSNQTLVLGGSPTGSGGSGGGYNYTWSPAANLSNSNSSNPTFTPPGVGTFTYFVTVNDPNGCSNYDTIVVNTVNCNCFMDSLFASIGACDPNTNNYDVTGSAYFTNPPANGLLIVYDSLTGIADTLYPPFVSPFNYNLNNIPSTGNNSAIYVYFTSDPNCVLNLSYTAPVNCQCTDNAGTVTAQVIGSGTNNYVLCDGDYIYIQTNNDYTNGTGPAPGLTYGIYTCPPTPGIDPATDPCYTGYVTGTIWNMADQNVGGSSGGLYAALVGAGATFNNNTIYFAPMTLIDTTGLLYDPNCVNVGAAIPVTYLEPIDAVGVQDCNANTVTVTITGGYPEIFPGNNYNISNLLPVTASLSSTTVGAHGGTVTITGLQAGDMYSFDITDDNGCPYNFSGGPFIDVVITDTTMTNESCYGACDGSIVITDIGATQYSIDNGVNFQAGNTFNNLCPGVYNVIASDGTCADTVIVTITGPNAPITIPPTITNASCFNDCDGQIVVAPSGGTPFTVGNPYTYAWTPSGGNTNIEQNLCAGAYTVRVTDANGCFVDSTFNITQPAQFTYTTASQASFCGQPDGWAAVVNFAGGDGGPYTYDWGSGPTPNDTLFNLSSGPYTVTVSDGVCDTTFNISVANNPAFSASITTTVNASCNGYNDGSATAAGSDPNATYNFLWDANAGNQATPTANNLTAGNYFCVVTDANTGCFDTAFVTITEPSPVVITNISPNITICVGANTNIAATASGGSGGGYTYTWNNGLGVGQNHNVSPVNNTTYEVWATDANGCPSDTAQVTVSLHPVLNVIASNDDSICPGEVVNISALGNGGNGGPYNYTWNNGVGAGQNHNVSPTTTTTYVVTLSDNCSPNVTDSVTIVVKPVPNITFTVDDPNGCEGGLYNPTFFNTTTPNPSGTNSNWLFGDGASASGDTVSHTYTNPGGYDVTLTVTYPPYSANEPGCSSSLTLTNFVEVFYNPVADFTANPNPTTMFEPTVNFFDQSYFNINQWHWNFGGLDTSNLQNPIYTFPEDTGNYPVTLTVTDINGCSASVTDYVIVKGEYGLFVPNAFTPNGDGDNDFFFPKGFGISADEYEFIIFDRWGEQIFYSQKTNEPWDGTYKGKRVQQGVYVWKINFKDINGENHSETGHVSIIK